MRDRRLGRRGFLARALQLAGGSATLAATGGVLGALAAQGARAGYADYKALVCLYLYGGNDGFNWLVPRDTQGYARYAQPRAALAIPHGELLPIRPASGPDLGLHPRCAGLAELFERREAAFVANCGVLLAPTTRADYLQRRELPPALFSHNDQTDHWMSAAPGAPKLSGWAGRMHRALGDANGASPVAMNLSLAGSNLCQSGGPMPAYILGQDGAALIDDIHFESANYYPYMDALALGESSGHALERSLARAMRNAFEVGEIVNGAIEDTPPPATPFDAQSELGRKLAMTARVIAAQSALGARRQVFFVALGGFDTHDNQAGQQARLLGEVDAAVGAFMTEMRALGLAESVTLFTMSDFGRTLTVNGDGTDHGWGSHHLVAGGAVRGGEIYGRMPDLTLDGPDDAGFGRIIPTTSTEQYLGALARWFGVQGAALRTVFPNFARFTPRTLDLMA